MKIRTLTILATILTITGGVFFSADAQVEQGQVPTWFKGVAGYWAEGKISQGDFINAIQFLVSQKIITLPNEVPSASAQTNQQTTVQTSPTITQGPPGPQGQIGPAGPQGLPDIIVHLEPSTCNSPTTSMVEFQHKTDGARMV